MPAGQPGLHGFEHGPDSSRAGKGLGIIMLDMKFVRENPELVKENIRKKFQEKKLPLVDEVIELDAKARSAKKEADALRASRNQLSKQIGALMKEGKK